MMSGNHLFNLGNLKILKIMVQTMTAWIESAKRNPKPCYKPLIYQAA